MWGTRAEAAAHPSKSSITLRTDPPRHPHIQVYSAVMILLYPVGIPVLFALLLLKRRNEINPSLSAATGFRSRSAAIESGRNHGRTRRPGITIDERGGCDREASRAVAGAKRTSAAVGGGSFLESVWAKAGEEGGAKDMGYGARGVDDVPATAMRAREGATVSLEEARKSCGNFFGFGFRSALPSCFRLGFCGLKGGVISWGMRQTHTYVHSVNSCHTRRTSYVR